MASRQLQTLCAQGELEKAMGLLSRAESPPPANAYLSLLKACKKSKALTHAKQVHAHITRFHVPLTGLLGDYLAVTLSMCGDVDEAVNVLCQLPQRSVYSWTSIISAYADCGNAQNALTSYQCMLLDGVEPRSPTFLALFSACGSISDLDQGRNLHANACMKGLDMEASVGNAILRMYLDCAALFEAENVFSSLPEQTLPSWNSMLAAFVDQGEAEKALQWYLNMKPENVEPIHYTFIILCKACAMLADIKQGETLHCEARKRGYAADGMVGSALITMYGKSGSILGAEDVFGGLLYRDTVSWNALLAAYVEQGFGEKAIYLYRQMEEDGVELTQRTYVIVLRACCSLTEKEEVRSVDGLAMKTISYYIGQGIHADAQKMGFLSDNFVLNTLVSMYGKCGAIVEAENLFGTLPLRDIVSWNAMLSAYIDHGEGKKTLCFLIQMERENMIPDQATFASALQAVALLEGEAAPPSDGRFSKRMSLEIGYALHGAASRYSLASDPIIGSALVSMYGRCWAIDEAEFVLCALTERTLVSWNALLSAYVERGKARRALQLYAQIQAEAIDPDQITYILALQACGILTEKEDITLDDEKSSKAVALLIGQALHAEAYKGCFAFDISIGNTLVNLYGKCGAIAEAENVFGCLPNRTIVSWNAMLSAYIEHGQADKALTMYIEIRKKMLRPDVLTFVCVLQSCGDLAENGNLCQNGVDKVNILEIGRALHVDCNIEGFSSHDFIRNSLMQMYGKCGAIEDAEEVWGVTWADGSTVLTLPEVNAAVGGAKHDFFSFSLQDMVAWNFMLSAYVELGLGYKAVWVYRQMLKYGVTINIVSITRILQACSATASLEICRQVHFLMLSLGFEQTASLASTLIHAYGSCASMVDADYSLREITAPDIVAWNSYIAGYAGVGDSMESLWAFDEVKVAADAQPNEVTFISIISACTQTGLVAGFHYFESMMTDFCVVPEPKHHCSLLDLLGRIGDFRRIEQMLKGETLQSSATAWLSLLGACHTHRNSVLAVRAYEEAINLQPNQAAVYVLMSNVVADTEAQQRVD